jgi:hypothetical protein
MGCGDQYPWWGCGACTVCGRTSCRFIPQLDFSNPYGAFSNLPESKIENSGELLSGDLLFEEKRYGRFFIPDKVLGDPKYRDAVRVLFLKVIPIKCEHHFEKALFEYIAWSEIFDVVQSESEMRTYKLVISDRRPNDLALWLE